MIDSIYITITNKSLKNKPYKKLIGEFFKSNKDKCAFQLEAPYRSENKIKTVYIIVKNKVRWRATFMDYEGETYIDAGAGQFIDSELFMLLIDFKKMPKPYEYKKGFSGIRYKYS